jgi:hypothetical protein
MKTSKFQKLLNYLRQVFQAGSNAPKNIPSTTGMKKASESTARHAAGDREGRSKKSFASKVETDTESNHHQHPSDNYSSESQAYKNFR